VSVTKTIYSYQFDTNVYKFTSYQKLLQGETGFTTNEPGQLALKEAIEAAVVHLTVRSVRDRFLELKDERDWKNPVFQAYLREGVTNLTNEEVDSSIIPMAPLTKDNQNKKVVSLDSPVIVPIPTPPPVVSSGEPPKSQGPVNDIMVQKSAPASVTVKPVVAKEVATMVPSPAAPAPAPAVNDKPAANTPVEKKASKSGDIFNLYWDKK
jgi:hypothetical protein